MSGSSTAPIYPLEVLLAAEARQKAMWASQAADRAASNAYHHERYMLDAYRQIAHAMDLATASRIRGRPWNVPALLLFERQWARERREAKKRRLRISHLDSLEQTARAIRLWNAAGVLAEDRGNARGKIPNWRLTPESDRFARQDRALEMHRAGLPYREIGDHLDVSTTVARRLAVKAWARLGGPAWGMNV